MFESEIIILWLIPFKMTDWYIQLIKPSWAPPAYLFGPVWTVLYVIIAITFVYAGWMFIKKKISFAIALPFILNIIFNLAFTPIQFGLKNNLLASVDIILVLATLFWLMIAIYRHSKWITYANIPYLLWVLFATALQLTITFLNF
ncbi:MAG: TspO/MBR family protein [Nitrospirota bacterium]